MAFTILVVECTYSKYIITSLRHSSCISVEFVLLSLLLILNLYTSFFVILY